MRTASARWSSTSPCSHSAPSCTAHTSAARSSPRRCVSTNAASAKRSASQRREKAEICRVQTSPRLLRVTSPITSVLTSAHSPPTRCTIAPSALSSCWSAPPGAWGTSCLRRSTSPSHTTSAASPVASVARRAVSLLTWIPTRSWRNSRACSNGIQLANRTSISSPRGVTPPLTSPNCSSRGKKAHPTLGAGAIRTRQLHCFPSVRLEEARLLSTCREWLATGRTPRTLLLRLLAPLLGLPHLHHLLDQLRPQLVDPFIHRRFNLCPRRLRVLFPPLGDPQHVSQSCAHLLHLLTPLPLVLLGFHALPSLLVVFPLFYHLLPVCKKMKHTHHTLPRQLPECYNAHQMKLIHSIIKTGQNGISRDIHYHNV